MALFRSAVRGKVLPTPGSNDLIRDWEMFCPPHYKNVKMIEPSLFRQGAPPGKFLRGSGMWGVESKWILRHVLWNRFKQGRPIRSIPSLQRLQNENVAQMNFYFQLLSFAFCYLILKKWSDRYGWVHDRFPWTPERIDGTPGTGLFTWFFQPWGVKMEEKLEKALVDPLESLRDVPRRLLFSLGERSKAPGTHGEPMSLGTVVEIEKALSNLEYLSNVAGEMAVILATLESNERVK